MTKRGIGLVVAVAVLVLGVVPADAWWGRPHVWIGPPWYPYPYYYAPPVVVQPSPPQVYVQPHDTAPAESNWYHCENPNGYYPYVKQCPGGWTRVAPQPSPAP